MAHHGNAQQAAGHRVDPAGLNPIPPGYRKPAPGKACSVRFFQ